MTRDRNDKTSLVIQQKTLLFPGEPLDPISRRALLHWGGAAAIVLMNDPLALFKQQAVASPILPWLAWTGRAALAGGISWLVGRALDRWFPDFGNNHKAAEKLADELNLKRFLQGQRRIDSTIAMLVLMLS